MIAKRAFRDTDGHRHMSTAVRNVVRAIPAFDAVFYSCFVDSFRLSCTISTLLALLLLPKMAERRFRPLGGVLDRN
jgi:hypothetical protein